MLFHRAPLVCLTLLVSALAVKAQITPLPVKVVDAQYSASLDRLILTSANPNQLHIYNPASGTSAVVVLALAPISLSVSPDGQRAAVGHNAFISYINLATASIEKYLPVSINVNELILGGNGYVYAFSGADARSVNIATAAETSQYTVWSVQSPALHPNGQWIYSTRGGSPDDIHKGEISTGSYEYLHDSAYHGDHPICAGTWLTQDGQRIINGCGRLFRTSPIRKDDIVYGGSLSEASSIRSAAHSTSAQRLAVIPRYFNSSSPLVERDTEIQFYEQGYLAFQGRVPLPQITSGPNKYAWHGRSIFYSADSSKIYVVVQADSAANLVNDFAVFVLPLMSGSCGATLSSLSANVPASGGSVNVSVTAQDGCLYQTTTTSPWLSVGSGAIASGSTTVTIQASPNLQTSPRTATVNIASQTFTLSQSAAAVQGVQPTVLLPFRPIDVEYSKALDRIVAISSSPNQLHIYDPIAQTDTVIGLPKPPKAVGVSPDGLKAAVGLDALVIMVDLQQALIEKNVLISGEVNDIVLDGSGYVHASFTPEGWGQGASVNIATGAETDFELLYNGYVFRLHPGGKAIYTGDDDLARYSIATGPMQYQRESWDANACGNFWFTEDSRIMTRCGTLYRTSETPADDFKYAGKLPGDAPIVGAAHSSARKIIVTLPEQQTQPNAGSATRIRFYSDDFLTALGGVDLPRFPAGPVSIASRGKYLFWDKTSARLLAVVQADPASGVLNDYALFTVSMNVACGATFGSPSASIAGTGGAGTVQVNAAEGCIWQASSSAPWLTITQNAVSAGTSTLSFNVDANTAAARTATITISGQVFTVTQAAGSLANAGPFSMLGFRVVDAEYSRALDRIIAVSTLPNRLNIYDPVNRTSTPVTLPRSPRAVSVSPDGLKAAVGFDALISIVNLQTAAVEKNLVVSGTVYDIVLAGNGWVYGSFQPQGWGTAVSVNIATGAETTRDLLYQGDLFRLHPDGRSIYTANVGLSPSDISRHSIQGGPMVYERDSPYHGDYPMCGNLWFTADGRVIVKCGSLFRTSDNVLEDMKYAGKLSGLSQQIAWADHSATRKLIAVVPEMEANADGLLTLHSDEFYSLSGQLTLPRFTTGGANAPNQGRWVFWNSSASRLYVVTQAGASAGVLNDFGVYTVAPNPNGCSVTLGTTSAQVGAGAGFGNVAVTGTTDCVWEVTVSVPWISLNTGTLGIGIGNAGFSVTANPTAAPRTGTLIIGGRTFTVTQAAGNPVPCNPDLSPLALIAPNSAGTGTINLTINSACTWTAVSSAPWFEIFPLSGTGSATLSYTVYPNFSSSTRTSTLTVSGKLTTITQQAGTGSANERFIRLLYFNMLGREASPAEVASQLGRLLTDGLRGPVTVDFFNSAEFNSSARFVAGLYVAILNRNAEFGGYSFQRNAMLRFGIAPTTMMGNFLNADEFKLVYPNISNADFVRVMYRQVLLREPSQIEVDFQTNALTGGFPRVAMAAAFLASSEFRNGTQARLNAFLLYAALLNRAPTDAEHTLRMNQLATGTPIRQLVDEIVQGAEMNSLLQ